jgi:hypothetical protein
LLIPGHERSNFSIRLFPTNPVAPVTKIVLLRKNDATMLVERECIVFDIIRLKRERKKKIVKKDIYNIGQIFLDDLVSGISWIGICFLTSDFR